MPSGLQTLTFGRDFNQSIVKMTPPSGLQTLKFGAAFNQSLEKVTLPSGLQTLTFGDYFNKSLEKVTLPIGLLNLTFDYCFNQSMKNVSLPDGLQRLTFGYNFSRSMDNVTLPAGLHNLTFGSGANQTMDCEVGHASEAARAADEAAFRAATFAADATAGLVDPASEAGAHALRSAARVQAIAMVSRARFDLEGLEQADVEAGSRPAWKRFVAALPFEERTLLRIFRCGAIRTPTRRYRHADQTGCPFCCCPNASARHFWQDCSRFNAMRAE